MYREYVRPASKHVWIYVLLQVCVLILTIVNLALKRWFSYCWWHFGLFAAESFFVYDAQLSGEHTITEVRRDACDSQANKDFVEEYCPSFCDYVENFEAAGIMMLCFALLAIVFTLISTALHVFLIVRRRNGAEYSTELIVMWVVLPALAYFMAFILYLLACNLGKLDSVRSYDLEDGEPTNVSVDPGLGMGIGVTCLYILVTVYSMFTTRKEF